MINGHHALVILSGGQDSTTCLAQAILNYGADRVHAVTFDYGQRHRVEIAAAKVIAMKAGIEERHELITINGLLRGASPLVNKDTLVDRYPDADVLPGGLEKTFVPMRNSLFLVLAANRAVMIGLEKGFDVDIITGVSQEDYGGYPDCRKPFINAMEATINLSLDDDNLPRLYIGTPLMHMSKAQTVRLSETIPGARDLLAHSHTCYNGKVPPCGSCHACLLRARGYAQAGVTDPLLDRLAMIGMTDTH